MIGMTKSNGLVNAELLKFDLLANGVELTPAATMYIDARNGDRPMTPADYASTSGVILVLEDDVWVNAPIVDHNANFVVSPTSRLDADSSGLFVEGPDRAARARFWLPPAFHGTLNSRGEPHNSFGFAHTDRVRVSPVEGCAFTCTFCDLPYEFRYRTKRVDGLIETARAALEDAVQPVGHVLISGGTPRPADFSYVRDCYEAVVTAFPGTSVDIMMVPVGEVMDPVWLDGLGVNEVSANLEIWSDDLARRYMPRKHKQGRDHYLDYLAGAASVLGGDRVRSMLMLGLEPLEETLTGVEEIAARGCTPVLSPFRPDPSTPLRAHAVPTAEFLLEAYQRAREITRRHGVSLGPSCIPCSHNTLTLSTTHGNGDADTAFAAPRVV